MNKILTITVLCFLCGCVENKVGPPAYNEDTLRNHVIPIDSAIQLTRSFRAGIDSFNRICGSLKDSLRFSHAEAFPADVFAALLAEKNDKQGAAKGIRIYLGRDRDGQVKLVLVPVDSVGNDMVGHIVDLKGNVRTADVSAGNGQAVEQGQHCPPICDNGSSGLN
jgi:hypothetical protein